MVGFWVARSIYGSHLATRRPLFKSTALGSFWGIHLRAISQWVPSKYYEFEKYILMPHNSGGNELTQWGRVTHICISKLTIIVSDNVLSPGRRQAIIWTNAGILLIGTLGTNFSEILSKIHTFSFKKMHLKTLSTKWWPSCLGLNVLTHWGWVTHICVGNLTIIGSDNGLSPGRRQAIIWTNAGILLIGTLGTNFSEISIEILTFSF